MAEEKKENKKNRKEKKKRSLFHKIVNVFLYFFLGIFVLLLILFGISQTSTFKDYLRDKVTEEVSSALNGELHIGEIEGTIFTSLILNDVVLNMQSDTLLKAESIEVRTSPLQLLIKKIYVRKFEIKNASINLVKYEDGELNISKLIPPSESPDTTSSKFPFNIEVADFKLTNVNFSLQDIDKIGSTETYRYLNLNDLRVKNINLSLSAFADINEDDFTAEIDDFSASPNLTEFNLKEFTGDFAINKKGALAENLSILTTHSNIKLDVSADDLNLFAEDGNTGLNTADLHVKLDTDKFSFYDLTTFVPATDLLKGKIKTNLVANGSLKEFIIDELNINLDNSQLRTIGKLINIDEPENLTITANFFNSYIDQNDVQDLLPGLNIPYYPELGMLRFDTLSYSGKPINFNFNTYLITDVGAVQVKGGLDLEKELMAYDLKFVTKGFNIEPFASIKSNLNSYGYIKGQGVSPENMNASLNLYAGGSTLRGNKIDTLRIIADVKNKFINYDAKVTYDTTSAIFAGNVDLSRDTASYKAEGRVLNFDVALFTGDTTFSTDLNAKFDAEGQSFDIEKIQLYASLEVFNTYINDIFIDSTRAIADIQINENNQRIINFISDIADVTVTGEYSVDQAATVISNEIQFLSAAVKHKMNDIFPEDSPIKESLDSALTSISKNINITESADSLVDIEYTLEFKNFELLSLFLGNNQLDIDGEVKGKLITTKDSISFSLNSDIKHIKFWGKNNVYFLANLDLSIVLDHSLRSRSLNEVVADISMKTNRLFLGSEIKDLDLNLKLKDNVADIKFNGKLEDYAGGKLNGKIDLKGNDINLMLDSLRIKYNRFDLLNDNQVLVSYSKDKLHFKQFKLKRDGAYLSLNGSLNRSGQQNLKVKIENLSGQDLSTNVLSLKQENSLKTNISFVADITGDFSSPKISIDLDADSVTYKNKTFGSLKSDLNYDNKDLNINVRFVDSTLYKDGEALKIMGHIPIDLSFESVEERFIEGKSMELHISANNFNLGTFGDVLPQVNHLRGILNANLDITGSPNDLKPSGSLTLRNGAFIAEANNMEFNTGLKVNVNNNELILDSLVLENSKNTENGGRMTGKGKAVLDGLEIKSSQFTISGMLKVLSEASKSASPSVYGELVIATEGNVEFKLDKEGSYLSAPVIVKRAHLTFPPTQGSYSNTSEKFIYRYVEYEDSTKQMDFESLLELAEKQQSNQQSTGASKESPFDFKIDVQIEDEATVIFVLSKEFNQNLTAVLEGQFQYERINGRTNAQGRLQLLEESTLEFIKTFQADGTIRFESDFTNPYLDITATYKKYYQPTDTSATVNNEELVAVKIRLEGPVKDLKSNFIQNENNVAVYVGEENINNNNADATKNATDAMFFIVTGEFPKDLSPQQRNEAAGTLAGPATSLAGSILGGFLNRHLGDYVRSVELRRVGSQTKFNLSGRVNNFRYSIGGATDVFQDLGQANVRIEYYVPFAENLLLRLERKEAINETGLTNEMNNEFGVKYKFEF